MGVQLRGSGSGDTLLFDVGEGDDIGTSDWARGVFRVTLDLPLAEVVQMAEKLVAYRKTLAEVRGIKPGKLQGRKELLEAWAVKGALEYLDKLKATFAELGPLPDADDAAAMRKYAQRVVAAEAKRSK